MLGAQSSFLEEYLQLRRSLAATTDGAARARIEGEAAAALEALLASARRRSRLLIVDERRGGFDTRPAIEVARLVARDGRVTLQALGGPRPQSPDWERAGVIAPDAYLAMLRRLLGDPTLAADWPVARFDPNAPGPRQAVVVWLAIGDDEREVQALGGPAYEQLVAVARELLELCRSVPIAPLR